MGSLLVNKFRETRGKNDIGEAKQGYFFKTGFDTLDYRLGTYVKTPDEHEDYFAVGLEEGTYIMVIGRTGSGKSSLAMQIAGKIARPYEDSAVFLDDVEAASSASRFKALTGWSDTEIENKFVHRKIGISAESFYKSINDIYALKMENKEALTIKTDKLDEKGEPIETLVPTVYILDSLAVLVPEKFSEEEELSSTMSQGAVAKTNSMIFQRILPKLKRANIILIVINHITSKIDINPMQKSKAQLLYLKADESIPGGTKPLYMANTLLKVETGSKLDASKDLGIDGNFATVQILKSRSNRAGRVATLVYNQNKGFINPLSNYNFLKEEKKIGGAGRSFYLDGCPDVKFAQKDFIKKLKESKVMQQRYKELLAESLSQFIYMAGDEEDETDNFIDLDDATVEEELVVTEERPSDEDDFDIDLD